MARGLLLSVLTAVVVVSWPALAQERAPLRDRPVESSRDPVVSMVRLAAGRMPGRPQELRSIPSELQRGTAYYVLQVGAVNLPVALANDRLYADANLDGDLTDEAALEGQPSPGHPNVKRFGPVAVTPPEGKGAPVSLLIEAWPLSPTDYYLRACPASVREARVPLGDQARTVVLVDADLDGRYATTFRPLGPPGTESDWLAVDADGNGKIEGVPYSAELMPLPKMVAVGGRYYRIDPAADGSSVGVAAVEPEFGALDVGSEATALALASDSGMHSLSGPPGKWELPAGEYVIRDWRLVQTDEDGTKWMMLKFSDPGKLRSFRIAPGEALSMPAGPPLTGKAKVTPAGAGTRMIGYSLFGRAGEEYIAGAVRGSTRLPAPAFTIVDETGKAVASGRFEYG